MIAGSANLTRGGLESNFEASLSVGARLADPVVQDLNQFRLRVHASSEKATEIGIAEYEKRFRINERNRKDASKKTEEELRSVFDFSSARVKWFLTAYGKSPDGNAGFASRRTGQRQARTVLDGICDDDIRSQAEFTERWSQLVGATGAGRLFASNGLFRAKSSVSKNWKIMVEMIRQIREAKGSLSPADMFVLAKSYSGQVRGLGVNGVTEVMNAYRPLKYPVLNGNPLASLKALGGFVETPANNFKAENYAAYTDILSELRAAGEFSSFAQVDHFLDFVYHILKKRGQFPN
jgi:hypothetical protein